MARIAIAGFQHETNTFAPIKAQYENFIQGEGWPGLTEGAAIFDVFPPINISIGGFIREAQALHHDLVPVLWANAVPSAHVTEDAYERIAERLLKRFDEIAGKIDAVYLDLHGAMVTEHLEDGEGEFLRRLRQSLGPEIPIIASLDLHANVTEAMVDHASMLIAYRTYPHVDMAAIGTRCARELHALLSKRRPPQAKAYRRVPFLLPLTQQCTMIEPSASIYKMLATFDNTAVSVASYTPGFPPADIKECGPSIFVYADTQTAADQAADAILAEIIARESQFAVKLKDAKEAVTEAVRLSNIATKPVVLADVQDNPGAGATSDTTGLLRALVDANAQDAVIAILTDEAAARAAHAAGEGAEIDLALGGKLFTGGDPPFQGRFKVERLSDGRFLCTGPFYGGTNADLGPSALLRIGDIQIIVASRRMQAADQAIFRHLGIEPKEQKILGLKSSVHFRADFTPIAEEIIPVAAAGAFIDQPEKLPYRHLRPGIRLGPNGPVR